MRVMAKFTPMAMLLVCACSSAQAADKIPNSAVPSRVRAAIQYYAPGAQLIEAKVSEDRKAAQAVLAARAKEKAAAS